MAKQHCVWVLEPAKPGVNPKYCGKDVRWTMTRDDDGNPVRKYDHLCREHRARAEYMEERDEV